MFRLVFLVPVIAAAGLAAGVVACSGDGDDDGGSSAAPTTTSAQPTAASEATRVTVVDFSFSPATLTARVGQPVNLNVVNNGQAPHTFTIANVADSGTINAGQSRSVSFTPAAAGTLQFVCNIHSSMTGTVTVQ